MALSLSDQQAAELDILASKVTDELVEIFNYDDASTYVRNHAWQAVRDALEVAVRLRDPN